VQVIDLDSVMKKCEAVIIIEGHGGWVCRKCRSYFLPPYWWWTLFSYSYTNQEIVQTFVTQLIFPGLCIQNPTVYLDTTGNLH